MQKSPYVMLLIEMQLSLILVMPRLKGPSHSMPCSKIIILVILYLVDLLSALCIRIGCEGTFISLTFI